MKLCGDGEESFIRAALLDAWGRAPGSWQYGGAIRAKNMEQAMDQLPTTPRKITPVFASGWKKTFAGLCPARVD